MNIAIVLVTIPKTRDLTDNLTRGISVINTDKYGNDDYSIIKAVEENLLKEFKFRPNAKLPTGIQMNIVKRDTVDNVKSVGTICTEFLLDEKCLVCICKNI